jgi:two-component system, NarL family, response regulator DevR
LGANERLPEAFALEETAERESHWASQKRCLERGWQIMSIKVLLAEDAEITRRAIKRLLESQDGIDFIGEATTFAQTMQMTSDLKPEVIVMDLHMPDGAKVNPPEVKSHLGASRLLAISFANDADAKALAESFGAAAILDKMDLGKTLIPAITQVAAPLHPGK